GWGEAINGGFGMVLDGTKACDDRIVSMLYFDVYNGLARRAWARNKNAVFSVAREMDALASFRITLPNAVNDDLLDAAID
ncbi:MAG: urocanate hydratase, partial [Chryseosolibacter sp.]